MVFYPIYQLPNISVPFYPIYLVWICVLTSIFWQQLSVLWFNSIFTLTTHTSAWLAIHLRLSAIPSALVIHWNNSLNSLKALRVWFYYEGYNSGTVNGRGGNAEVGVRAQNSNRPLVELQWIISACQYIHQHETSMELWSLVSRVFSPGIITEA